MNNDNWKIPVKIAKSPVKVIQPWVLPKKKDNTPSTTTAITTQSIETVTVTSTSSGSKNKNVVKKYSTINSGVVLDTTSAFDKIKAISSNNKQPTEVDLLSKPTVTTPIPIEDKQPQQATTFIIIDTKNDITNIPTPPISNIPNEPIPMMETKDIVIANLEDDDDFDEFKPKPKPPPKKSKKEIASLKIINISTPDEKKNSSNNVTKNGTLPTKNYTPRKRTTTDPESPDNVKSTPSSTKKKEKKLKQSPINKNDEVQKPKEYATEISKVLPQTLKNNQLYLEESEEILKNLQNKDDPKLMMDTLSQLSAILVENPLDFSKILRSQSLFSQLCSSLIDICNHSLINSTSPVNNNNSNCNVNTTPSPLKRNKTFDSSDLSNSPQNLMALFMESSTSLSQTSVNSSMTIDSDNFAPSFLQKKSKSTLSSILSSQSTKSKNNKSSPQFQYKLMETEKKAAVLASCFIFYVLSSNQMNLEQFTKSSIEFIIQRSLEIPDNYILEFFTTPSKLPKSPKSPKSPGRSRKLTQLELNINNHFQQFVSDTARFSVSPSSLSLATLSNLASNHINKSMKSKLCEYGVIEHMNNLLEKYIIYLNPILDITSISPKLIGNIEYVFKILDETLMGDIKIIREKFVNFHSLNLFITYIRYLNIIINNNSDRLAGIDIKLIGSEAILSILKILVNITHENNAACKIIGSMDQAFCDNLDLSNCNNSSELEFKEYYQNIASITNNNSNNTIEQTKKSLTPRKLKFLESIKITKDFGFKTIISLLKLEVPEKYDIGQMVVSLLVNLVESNPENREVFRSIQGAIDNILHLYLVRASEKIITRFTSKTQEKVASSYLVILIGFLIKDNPINRKQVLDTLPSHSFDDLVVLLQDFIEFQSSNYILSGDVYNLCIHLIQDIYLQDKSSVSEETLQKYKLFKEEFDKSLEQENK
ncbi:hypothetical protein DLAC_01444 [Tieghemostelium lacteum]|uniref:WAPL domain-containing protein n=1 Tax=Tieghemostelium lacteum TaxID=361077 RepID=A0A152A5F6_TIELA|nr:hypothetical protein DLAC_01444 [Tieghemostelium lacteum]|eukprot:KYR01463.1 hypothetical protein DLAC_01444 [Tieghemostelium lacteum]